MTREEEKALDIKALEIDLFEAKLSVNFYNKKILECESDMKYYILNIEARQSTILEIEESLKSLKNSL